MKIFATINDETVEVDIRHDPQHENRFIATLDGREIPLVAVDPKPGSITLSIDGRVGFYEFRKDKGKIVETVFANRSYKTQLRNPQQEQLERLLEEFGAGMGGSASDNKIKAPMPGKILALSVKPGDKVELGQVVCVLEAMKMENEISSTAEGVVREVAVKVGESVQVDAVMIEVEPAS